MLLRQQLSKRYHRDAGRITTQLLTVGQPTKRFFFISPPSLHNNNNHHSATTTTTTTTIAENASAQTTRNEKPWMNGPGLSDFINKHNHHHHHHHHDEQGEVSVPSSVDHYLDQHQRQQQEISVVAPPLRRVFIETYGCQMNVSDTEIILSVMKKAGYDKCDTLEEADVVFLNTCAIRDNAEQKVWRRLEYIRDLKSLNRFSNQQKKQPLVGVLGCMAERLKTKLLEKEKLVDVVAGPDAYRDLPRLLHIVDHEEQQHAVNVLLSADETYADIAPTRTSDSGVSAFVTIMRGCDNMCSYCIVPFTRGRERSRPIESILEEVKQLSDRGFKEITLLGQNVNSYCDQGSNNETESEGMGLSNDGTPVLSNEGFKTIYKPKKGGIRFTELVDRVSKIDPEMRIRFTSPHPKDFPDDLLRLIRDRPNVCKQIHMPAQSGNTEVLDRMRRGYSREAYLELVDNIRTTIPGVALSSDFISGFCGETEEQHQDTLSLLDQVQYEHGFLFAYSLREKTHAHRKYSDDVPEDVKKRRLAEAIEIFRKRMIQKLEAQIGKTHLVLVDGTSKRSQEEWIGRTDTNFKVLFKKGNLALDEEIRSETDESVSQVKVGDYIQVKITSVSGATLRAEPICKTTLASFTRRQSQVI